MVLTNTYGVDFDGVDDYVDCGTDASINQIFSGGGTIDLWVYVRSFSNNDRLVHHNKFQIMVTGLSGSDFRIVFYHVFTGDDLSYRTTDHELTLDTWHHIRVEYDNGDTANVPTITIDGSIVALTQNSAPTGTAETSTTGVYFGGVTSAFRTDCILDEISFWSATSIADTYNSGYPSDLSLNANYAADCVSWWRMGDGDTYPTLQDTKGSNDGTMTNMASGDIVTGVLQEPAASVTGSLVVIDRTKNKLVVIER